MVTMKCNTCEASWQVKEAVSRNIDKCPFCGSNMQSINASESIPEVVGSLGDIPELYTEADEIMKQELQAYVASYMNAHINEYLAEYKDQVIMPEVKSLIDNSIEENSIKTQTEKNNAKVDESSGKNSEKSSAKSSDKQTMTDENKAVKDYKTVITVDTNLSSKLVKFGSLFGGRSGIEKPKDLVIDQAGDIVWEVIEDDNDELVLFATRNIIKSRYIQKLSASTGKWHGSYLFELLQNDFYNYAFSEDEKQAIQPYKDLDDEKVSMLSYSEWITYYKRRTRKGVESGDFWLKINKQSLKIFLFPYVGMYGKELSDSYDKVHGVRPVIRVSKSAVIKNGTLKLIENAR